MKKRALLLSSIFLLSSVSAQQFGDVGQFMTSVVDAFKRILSPIFEALLNESKVTEPIFFSKILLLFLLFGTVYSVLKRVSLFESNKGIVKLIAAIVSLLGVRFISDNGIIEGILLPYGTLAVAITSLLPIFVYFWVVHDSGLGPHGRRFAWIIYGVTFALFAITRSGISSFSYMMYAFGIGAVIVFVLFDQQIHSYFGTAKSAKLTRGYKLKQLVDLEADIAKYRAIPNPSPEAQRVLRNLEARHSRLAGEL